MKQTEFLELIKLLEDNYNKVLPDGIKRIWYEEFKYLQAASFKKMVIESIKEYTYFPTVNQVKAMYSKIPLEQRNDFKIEGNIKYKYNALEGWLIYETVNKSR